MADGVDVTVEGARAIVTVRGEVDIATCPELDAAVAGADAQEVVLDLSAVTFMASSGLASLLRADRVATERGGRLVLRAPSRAVVDVLEMTRLADRFTVEPR